MTPDEEHNVWWHGHYAYNGPHTTAICGRDDPERELVRVRLPTLGWLYDHYPNLREPLLNAAIGGRITYREFAEALREAFPVDPVFAEGVNPDDLIG